MRKIAILFSLVFSSPVANATPVEVTARGRVWASVDNIDAFGFGAGIDTILGATVTSTFMFDTDDAPPNLFPADPTRSTHFDGTTSWVDAWVAIDTVASIFYTGDYGPGGADQVDLWDQHVSPSGPEQRDSYLIYGQGGEAGDGFQSYAWVSSTVHDLINSYDLDQTFVWSATAGDSSYGQFSYYVDDVLQFFALFEPTTFTARPLLVPEPATLLLFGTTLLALTAVRARGDHRRKTGASESRGRGRDS